MKTTRGYGAVLKSSVDTNEMESYWMVLHVKCRMLVNMSERIIEMNGIEVVSC